MGKKVTKDMREEKRMSYPKCPTCLRTQTTLELPDGSTKLWCIYCNSYNLAK
jgi:LSD1 subclass zinc finger protein